MKKTHKLRNFLIMMMLVITIALGYYVFNETELFIIKDVNVFGVFRLSEEEIEEYLGVNDGLHYFKANQHQLLDMLIDHPVIKNGEVTKVFPDMLDIKVVEREPVVAVFFSGYYLLIDEELVVVEVSSGPRNFYPVEGYYFENFYIGMVISDKNSDILKRVMDLVFLLAYSELEVETSIKLVDDDIILSFSEELIANFGDGENIESRFNGAMALYYRLVEEGNDKGIIRANHDGGVVLAPFGK